MERIGKSLRECNSEISYKVRFNKEDPQCVGCPEFVACERHTVERAGAALISAKLSTHKHAYDAAYGGMSQRMCDLDNLYCTLHDDFTNFIRMSAMMADSKEKYITSLQDENNRLLEERSRYGEIEGRLKDQDELETWRDQLEEQDSKLQEESAALEIKKDDKDVTKLRRRKRTLNGIVTDLKKELRVLSDAYLKLEKNNEYWKRVSESRAKAMRHKMEASTVNTSALDAMLALRGTMDRMIEQGVVLDEEAQKMYDHSSECLATLFTSGVGMLEEGETVPLPVPAESASIEEADDHGVDCPCDKHHSE